jgi:hypothetical protein
MRDEKLPGIYWTGADQPASVVGVSPDGGFFVHASLHPFGAQGARERASQQGVKGRELAGEIYFPMPWIRAELERELRNEVWTTPESEVVRIRSILIETLPSLQRRASLDRLRPPPPRTGVALEE